MKIITKREQEVLELISQEFTTSEIADYLHISENTAMDHRKHLLHKLNARNVAGLVRKAFELGLIPLTRRKRIVY